MGLFEHWPYVNFHDLNLDWIIKEFPKVYASRDEAQASADASAESAAASHLSAEAALASQEAAHQSELNAAQSEENAAASEAGAKNYADNIADPVSGIVTTWLENNIVPTTPAIDKSLSISGAAADALAAGEYIKGMPTETFNTPANNSYTVNRPLHKGVLYGIKINTTGATSVSVIKTDDTTQQISDHAENGAVIMLLPEEELKGFRGWSSKVGTVELTTLYPLINDGKINGLYNYKDFLFWEVGSIYNTTGADYDGNTYSVRTPEEHFLYLDHDVVIYTEDEQIKTVGAFKYNGAGHNGFNYVERVGITGEKYLNLPGGYYYRFVLYANDTSIVIDDPAAFASETNVVGVDLAKLTYVGSSGGTIGKVVNTNMLSNDVHVLRHGSGLLKYHQSFLIYNNHFYSTDGNNIAEQDEDFNIIRDVEIYLGHGNSFMKGDSNIAYASGWDDNKIYVVNLDSLTVTNVIDLPTSGYTTAAIDEKNSIAYIFQRDSRPNTEEKYNVIKYNYATGETIDMNQTTEHFGAMQACDLYKDRIIVIAGTGTAELPTKIMVFNTTGQILAEYKIPLFENTEMEGVYYDHDANIIYVSTIGKIVFKIS